MRTLTVGWYGHGNIGDELLSIASFKILQDAFGQSPVIASVNPRTTAQSIQGLLPDAEPKIVTWPESLGLKSFASLSLLRTIGNVMTTDLVCIGGGGMLSDWKGSKVHRWLEFISLCKRIGKKTALLGIGAGPFFDKSIAERIGTIIDKDVDLIITRDLESKRYLEEDAGVTKQITVLTDLVFYLTDIIRHESIRDDSIVANFIPFSDLSKSYIENIVTFLRAISKDKVVKLLPFHESDLEFNRMLRQQVKTENLQVLPLQSSDGVIETLNSCDTAILTRYHSIVLCTILGVPFIPLVYHHKSAELVHIVGLDEYALNIGDGSQWKRGIPSSQEYLDSINRIQDRRNIILNEISRASNRQLAESRQYVRHLRKLPQ